VSSISTFTRTVTLTAKIVSLIVGFIVLLLGLLYVVNEFSMSSQTGFFTVGTVISMIAGTALVLSGGFLLAALPESLRTRFPRIKRRDSTKPSYGFSSLLAVGLGATLGSPLFILIPLNVIQYEFVSLASLALATALSVLMAKVYQDMYLESAKTGSDALGGPSFTKLACGTRSVRYFVSRLSMWIANVALAAYSKLIFIVFDFELMPGVLTNVGVSPVASELIVWAITLGFIGWTILNVLFEQRLLRVIGHIQIALTGIMVVILLIQDVLLGDRGSWNLTGLLNIGAPSSWIFALVINTGYLYLLFFGFQEIQALERDVFDYSSVPVISWILRGYRMKKTNYLGVTMVLSVIIASVINILYGVAVFSLHPNYTMLVKSQIPALYIAYNFLGAKQELLVAVAFLLATITTFVPSFLAASRHLGALSEDGFMPESFSRYSYLFTLVAILILAVGNGNFLIDITDFIVLISLGVISLSPIWLHQKKLIKYTPRDILPLVVGLSCFVAGGAIYFVSPSVAIFGGVSLAFAYLIYDIYELGTFGIEMFMPIFNATIILLLITFGPQIGPQVGASLGAGMTLPVVPTSLLTGALGLSTTLIIVNFVVDLSLLRHGRTRRTSFPYERGPSARDRTRLFNNIE
jgi:amino acid transporter